MSDPPPSTALRVADSRRGKDAAKRVVVVGAGPGGLATAMLLCARGFRVTVVERLARPGGRMAGFDAPPFAFDTGPTILQVPALLDALFACAGLRRADYVELRRVEPSTRVCFWDGTHLDTSSDLARTRAELARLVPDGARRFDAYYRHQAAKYRATYGAFLAADASDPRAYLQPLALARAARFRPWRSLHEELMDAFGDERVVYALSYPAKYLGLHPRTCSSVFSVIAFLELAFGVWHPMGGFRALAAGMARAVEDRGGRVRLGADVARVCVEHGRAAGVELTGGERLDADEVVVNADWADARRRLIPEAARPSHDDLSIERRSYSCSAFMLYLGLDTIYPAAPHHTVYLSHRARSRDPDALEDRVLDLDDPPFYVCNPCVTDPSGAPSGGSTLYVLVPCPNTSRAIDWRAVREHLAGRVLERLAGVGLADVARHVVSQRTVTAETWRDAHRVFRGAVFSLAHGYRQLGPLRPRAADDDVDNLYWVGGGTHPGSGLVTIFEGARIVASRIARAHGQSAPRWDPPAVA